MKNLLRIHLFGPPHVLLGDQRTRDFPTEKAKLLFCYLVLLRHARHPRSVLAGLFWGDSTELHARHSLNTTLWRLRHWLEVVDPSSAPVLLTEDDGIAFNRSSAYWLDTSEFEERITWAQQMNASAPDKAASSLNHAIDLYRGELIEGCYADWCLYERSRLQQLFRQALVQLMVYHSARGEYTQAISFAQRILFEEPLHEEVQRELMKLFALNHQPHEALLQYHRFETVLREELGIQPMQETQEVFRQLILRTTTLPTQRQLAADNAPSNFNYQSKLLLQKLDATLKQIDTARDELSQAFELFRQICHQTSFHLRDKESMSQDL